MDCNSNEISDKYIMTSQQDDFSTKRRMSSKRVLFNSPTKAVRKERLKVRGELGQLSKYITIMFIESITFNHY